MKSKVLSFEQWFKRRYLNMSLDNISQDKCCLARFESIYQRYVEGINIDRTKQPEAIRQVKHVTV